MGCAKAFLFFFNFIYLGVSAGIIVLAAWVIKKYGDITKITTDEYTLVPCGILVGVGVLIFITALFGCCGTCRDNKCCLSTFFALLLIVFAVEVTAGVLGYVYKDKARTFVNDGFVDAIKHYDDKDSALDKAVDDLQKNLKCCGSEGGTDWAAYMLKHGHYPKSCCANTIIPCTPLTSYNEGCLDKLTDKVKHNLNYIMGAGIGLAVLQLLGMIGACYLMCCSRESGYLQLEGGIRV